MMQNKDTNNKCNNNNNNNVFDEKSNGIWNSQVKKPS